MANKAQVWKQIPEKLYEELLDFISAEATSRCDATGPDLAAYREAPQKLLDRLQAETVTLTKIGKSA